MRRGEGRGERGEGRCTYLCFTGSQRKTGEQEEEDREGDVLSSYLQVNKEERESKE